jgi:hypothetical protein
MDSVPPFNGQQIEAICRILADTDEGLTGAEIGRFRDTVNLGGQGAPIGLFCYAAVSS